MSLRMFLVALLPALAAAAAAAKPPFRPTGNVVEATLVVARAQVAPDGVPVTGYTVNGSVWGPVLTATLGDTWRITVVNTIPDQEWSMHFHGQHVWGSPWEDGTGYVSSWAIAPGSKYTYVFPAYPSGTSFYHSHMGAQRMSGGAGAMIVRPPRGEDPYEHRYVSEHILGVSDWWHLTWRENMMAYGVTSVPHCFTFGGIQMGSGVILGDGAIFDKHGVGGIPTGDNGCWNATSGDFANPQGLCVGAGISDTMLFVSGIVSGTGKYNWTEPYSYPGCWGHVDESTAPACGTSCGSRFSVTVNVKQTYRFRLIGNMALFAFQVCIDHHPLTVIGVDGRPTKEKTYDCLILNPGERFDVLVSANKAPGIYKIRFTTLEETIGPIVGSVHDKIRNQFFAELRYAGTHYASTFKPPPSEEYYLTASTLGCATIPTIAMPSRCHQLTELQPHASALIETPVSTNETVDVALEVRVQFLGDPVTRFGNMDKHYHNHNSRLFATPLNESTESEEGAYTFRKLPGNRKFSPSFVVRSVPVLLAAAGGENFTSIRKELEKPTLLYQDFRERAQDDAVGDLGKVPENRVVVKTTIVDIPAGSKVRLVYNGRAGPSYANHPLHLHAHTFQLRGIGAGNWRKGYESRLLPVGEALLKDTMPAYLDSWIAVDYVMNKPGIWMMHCHQIVHSYGGMALLFNVSAQQVRLPDKFHEAAPPSANNDRLAPVSGPLTDYESLDGPNLIGRCVGLLKTFHANSTPVVTADAESHPGVRCPFNNVGAGCFTAMQSGDVLYQDQVHRITAYQERPSRYSVTRGGLLPFTTKPTKRTPQILASSRSRWPGWEAKSTIFWVLLASCPLSSQVAAAAEHEAEAEPEPEPEPEPELEPSPESNPLPELEPTPAVPKTLESGALSQTLTTTPAFTSHVDYLEAVTTTKVYHDFVLLDGAARSFFTVSALLVLLVGQL
eukprot:TRINITY_DN19394_c1_g1_i1.p1 TRINITY_DN19394_c1_g1~~TRINITY_DN19394_c1_g1_i1.p1  ORF type:complete len:976 (-),score=116.74 TRINITY_DN19394_c1_g1_i1:361-3216(-)